MKKRTEDLMRMVCREEDILGLIGSCGEEFRHASLPEEMRELLDIYGVRKADVIARSGLNQIYAYQIFAGTKKPSRDKLLALMFGFPLKVADGDLLLKAAGLAGLYPRDRRDAVVIHGLSRGLKISEVDDLLYELGEDTLLE